MEDHQIVDLYWERSEGAITETDKKYGRMLAGISSSLVSTHEDAEECVSDTYLAAWNNMPSDRPVYLGAYLSKIVRRISIDRFRSQTSQKRGGGGMYAQELSDCIPSMSSTEGEYDERLCAESINRYLYSLSEDKRYIFVRRYFYSDSIEAIALSLGISSGKVKTTLFRLRSGLKKHLEREGVRV